MSGEEAAVDGEVGAGDVGGIAGEQERDGGGGFSRGADALEGDAAVGDGLGALGVGLGELGVNDAWLEFVDPDATGGVVPLRRCG